MVVATVPSGHPGRLLVLTDSPSKQWFLVDTSSAYSIFPHQSTAAASGPAIMTADRTPIACWGRCKRTNRRRPPEVQVDSIGVVAAGSSTPSVDSSPPSVGSPAGGCLKGCSKRPRKAAAAVDPPSSSVDSSPPSHVGRVAARHHCAGTRRCSKPLQGPRQLWPRQQSSSTPTQQQRLAEQ